MTDFGISKEGIKTKDARTQTFCGTPEYLAPEVLEGKPYGNAVSRKMKLFLEESVIYKKLQIDWWSLGILIYEMMTGYPPFYAEDVQVMYQRILHERIEYEKKFQDSDLISLLCTSRLFLFLYLLNQLIPFLADGLLERDPQKRLADAAMIKKHPFFVSINWERLLAKEIKPAFVPKVSGKEDTANIADIFINEEAKFTPEDPRAISAVHQHQFNRFTYVAPAAVGLPPARPSPGSKKADSPSETQQPQQQQQQPLTQSGPQQSQQPPQLQLSQSGQQQQQQQPQTPLSPTSAKKPVGGFTYGTPLDLKKK